MPVVQALGTLGIGCVYIPGENIEDVERVTPVSGIRLAFVDMKLGIEGTARQVVGKTVGVLSSVLSKETSPVVIVAWTDHPEFVDEFESAIKRELPFLTPLLIHRMQKPRQVGGQIGLTKVTEGVRRILKAHWPLGVIWALEQLAHDAATNTTQAVLNAATREQEAMGVEAGPDTARADAWLGSLQSLLKTLIFAAAGSNLTKRETQVALLEAFNAMHFERLQSKRFSSLLNGVSKLCERDSPRLPDDQKAMLNTMLLLSPVEASDRTVRPGNLYLAKPKLKSKCPVTRSKITAAQLISTMPELRLTKDPDWKKADDARKAAERKTGSAGSKDFKKILTARRQAIVRSCLPALLELTPACDYANRKAGPARFIAGILVPAAHIRVFDWDPGHTPFLRKVELLSFPGKTGVWQLILNVRALYAIPNAEKKIDAAATVRFRSSIQTDILAWFGANATRPGYVSVR